MNPPEALRCDCGYDFSTRTVERAYFQQPLPKDIKVYLVITVSINILGALLAIFLGDPKRIVFVGVYSLFLFWLYYKLVQRRGLLSLKHDTPQISARF